MANRNNKAAKAATATAAKAAPALRAAAIIGQHGLAAAPRVAAAIGNAPASVKRYGATVNGLNASFANATFTLNAAGKALVAAQGRNAHGRLTAMGLTAVALANAANGGTSATGAAIVAAIIGNPQLMAAMLGNTKAAGCHILPGTATAAAWAKGYVNGLCRPQHAYATKA